MRPIQKYFIYVLLILLSQTGCKKLVEIPAPINTITTSQVFSTDNQAVSAMAGIYYRMINDAHSFSSRSMTIYAGMSADELNLFDQTSLPEAQFQHNDLTNVNPLLYTIFWNYAYSYIYASNAIIAGLSNNEAVHDSVKKELTGEAKFIRAFCNFYLVNLWGDIPSITTTNWQNTSLLGRTATATIYQNIVSDLIDAKNNMASDYSVGKGQKIIPNSWAATALLARVYLYLGDWGDAETQATAVINNTTLFGLEPNLNNIFLTNSQEAIWQLEQDNIGGSTKNATQEGAALIPRYLDSIYPPYAYLTPQQLQAFEVGDKRDSLWIQSTTFNKITYYIPYKYKVGTGQESPGAVDSEYYMVFRLAEQFLIRAEARANLNKLSDAANDLNKIRNRAGLNNSTASSSSDLLAAIMHERQIELFAEWGNRWLDLKRTGQATVVLSPIKTGWSVNDQLFPIPLQEIESDPNLTQNPGY